MVVPLKTTFLRENFISAFRIFWFCQKYKPSSLQKACTSIWVLHEHLDFPGGNKVKSFCRAGLAQIPKWSGTRTR